MRDPESHGLLSSPMLPYKRKLCFHLPYHSFQRSNKDKGTGWRDGKKQGHEKKKEVKPVFPRKTEMR